jgi:hypothetical protein
VAPAPSASSAIPSAVSDALRKQQAEIEKLTKEVSTLRFRLSMVGTEHDSAEFDPTNSQFQRIDSDLGIFFVSVQDVKPFGDGVRVRLHIGNPTAASYAGLKLQISYGARSPKEDEDAKAWESWYSTIKEKEESITSTIASGSWNPNYVTLPAIVPERFGYLRISLNADQLSLRAGESKD